MYTLKDLLLECSSEDGSGPLEDYATVWRAMTKSVEEAIRAGKGINLPHFGRFTIVKNSLREGPGIKGKVFVLSETFQRNNGALFKKPGLGLLAGCTDLNLAKICVLTQLDKDSAQTLISHLFQSLGRAIGKGHAVRVTFGRVGVLVAEENRVCFSFYSEDSIPDNVSVMSTARGERPTLPASEAPCPADASGGTSTPNTQTGCRGKEGPNVPPSARKTSAAATTTAAARSTPRKKSSPSVPPLPFNRTKPPTHRGGPASNNNRKAEDASSSAKAAACLGKDSSREPVTVSRLMGPTKPVGGEKKEEGGTSQALTEDNVRHLPGGVDVDLTNIRPTNLFPSTKAMSVGPTTGGRYRDSWMANERTMMDAYHRLGDRLARQVTEEQRAQMMIKERESHAEQVHQRERVVRKQRQEEWRAYLSKQAEEQRMQRKKEHYQDFLAPPPVAVTAYPQNGPYDRDRKLQVEKSLRQALEDQIKIKEEKRRLERQQELQADQQLIQWVHDEDRQERNNRLAKKILERESLFREWNLQKAHLAEVKRLGPGKIS